MRAGPLDRRVTVQRRTLTQSPSGEPIEEWAAIGGNRWASKQAVSGFERYTFAQREATEQVEFRLRWSTDLADLQPTDRIIEPSAPDSPPVPEPSSRSIYDILAVFEIGRREGLRVIAARYNVVNP